MSTLKYPFPHTPESGQVLEVAEGLGWLRMPLPLALDHINLYLLDDGDGWWVVDTGIGGSTVQQLWLEVFRRPMADLPIKGVVATHMHPDHIGQAGWLCERFQAPLYMTFGEYFSARSFVGMTADDLDWTTQLYFRRAGMDDGFLEQMKANWQGMKGIVEPLPGSYVRLREGDVLTIGGRRWRVVVGRGHSPEHACLFCEEDRLLLSGDQIIPRITSNVSVMPSEPDADPLADWLESLGRLQELLPADTLVLPAHNTPFFGVQARLRQLQAHHADHLSAVETACLAPRTLVELLPVLFSRPLEGPVLNMALGECLSHVNYLLRRGRLQRQEQSGVYYYRATDPERAGQRLGRAHHRHSQPLRV